MDWEAIQQRIEAGENQNTEFKLGLGDLSALGITICAFANSTGGILDFGVDDQLRINGIPEAPRKVQERLTSFLHMGCSQPVTAWIGCHAEDGVRVFWVALVNAVIHRDYAIIGSTILFEVFSDWVVVSSPGSLPNHLTVEQVRAGANPRARNDPMGHHMASMGYMESRGRRWLIMQREMQNFNGAEPTLAQNLENSFVRVTFLLGTKDT